MFQLFTDRAKFSMAGARAESQRLRHEYIGTEHILLGILRSPDCLGTRLIAEAGVEIDALRAEVERAAGMGATAPTAVQLPFTLSATKSLELAMAQASALGDAFIGTEHLVLGLIREESGPVARVFETMGVSFESARGALSRVRRAK